MEQEVKSSRRRYKEGREFHYDYVYGVESYQSDVLNQIYQSGEMDYLLEAKQKRVQQLEEELELVVAARKLTRQTLFNKGSRYTEGDRSREKRVTLEARIDVLKWEIDELEEAIENAEEEKSRHDKLPVLPYGPIGTNQVRGTTGSGYVDGQWAEYVENVGLVITDKRSPYRGMKVEQYISEVAKPWLRASREYNTKRREEEIAAGKKGEELPSTYPFPWPEFPAHVRNHLNGKANGKASPQRTSMLRRTK